jgi:hypothetical protein
MKIYASTKPYGKMRYPTLGDYDYTLGIPYFDVYIAETGNIAFDMAIFIHEIKELFLCWQAGIKEEDIRAFDIMFEEERKQGLHGEDDEPGDDPRSPYYHQHQKATQDEKKWIKDTGNKWKDYCKSCMEVEE